MANDGAPPNSVCGLCRKPLGTDWNWDHIVPRALGGLNLPHNLQRVHRQCNQWKGAFEPVVFCIRCRKSMLHDGVDGHWEGMHWGLTSRVKPRPKHFATIEANDRRFFKRSALNGPTRVPPPRPSGFVLTLEHAEALQRFMPATSDTTA